VAPTENTYDNKARLYNEFNHKFSETVQYKFWLEYVPNFTQSKDYLVNAEASLTSILTSMFSLKVAYKGMYDNLPAVSGYKNYDYATTTSLVAKF
jgi:putative salt-induced outer membrane protein